MKRTKVGTCRPFRTLKRLHESTTGSRLLLHPDVPLGLKRVPVKASGIVAVAFRLIVKLIDNPLVRVA